MHKFCEIMWPKHTKTMELSPWLRIGLCSPLAMLDGSRFSCHATIIEHDMKLMSIAKK